MENRLRKSRVFENYPCWIVVLSNSVSIAVYFVGSYIIYQLGLVWLLLYILYVLILEIRLMKKSCINCFYYGKDCAFGKGKMSAVLFKKGDPNIFKNKKISWKDILPDFLVSIIPLVVGIILLVGNFSWLILSLLVLLIVLSSVVSGFVRSSLACKFCKQREIGCAAEQLFNKKNMK